LRFFSTFGVNQSPNRLNEAVSVFSALRACGVQDFDAIKLMKFAAS
jgi:hypothetical protein